jgi:hypothetical protein
MAVNNRSDEVPTEEPPRDGPLNQLVEEKVHDVPTPATKEYAEGTTEHDDDSEA